jgi:hypothetical protein
MVNAGKWQVKVGIFSYRTYLVTGRRDHILEYKNVNHNRRTSADDIKSNTGLSLVSLAC